MLGHPRCPVQDIPPLRPSEAIAPQLVRALRTAIVMMHVQPGQALSETEIARQFGVSRQPVREAFIKLAEAGLVEIRPQRGTFVVPITRRDVMNARFIREAIEVAVVGVLAERITPAIVAELRRLLDDQRRAAVKDDWPGFLALDEAFHRTLAESAGHAHAWRMLDPIKAQMDRVRYLSFSGASPLPVLIKQHTAIVEALARRKRSGAEAAMRKHLREILTALPAIAAEHPDLFDADSRAAATAA
ncbi:MAG: GntR family transcriptional regulator [Alphaproteobacteria bacterium]|nr:GntR family transcriptional regulator [Alphaproteobacteria bacterium]